MGKKHHKARTARTIKRTVSNFKLPPDDFDFESLSTEERKNIIVKLRKHFCIHDIYDEDQKPEVYISIIKDYLKEIKARQEQLSKNASSHRDKSPRQQSDIEIKTNLVSLEYPFSHIQNSDDHVPYPRCVRQIPGQPVAKIGNFPHNIQHYYWIFTQGHSDENEDEDEDDEHDWLYWLVFCKLTNGTYVYYVADSTWTGFTYGYGDMAIYASKHPEVLIEYAMSDRDYAKYIRSTTTKSKW